MVEHPLGAADVLEPVQTGEKVDGHKKNGYAERSEAWRPIWMGACCCYTGAPMHPLGQGGCWLAIGCKPETKTPSQQPLRDSTYLNGTAVPLSLSMLLPLRSRTMLARKVTLASPLKSFEAMVTTSLTCPSWRWV